MRKLFCLFLALILALLMAVPCFAAGSEASAAGDLSYDVYARFVRDLEWEDVLIENGSAASKVGSCTVSVSGAPDNALYLRVISIPSSEAEAWCWFSGCIGSEFTIQNIFDIYFVSADGERINADGAVVSISGLDNDCTLRSVTTGGKVSELEFDCEDKSVRFTTDGSNYYLAVKESSPAPTPTPTPVPSPSPDPSPSPNPTPSPAPSPSPAPTPTPDGSGAPRTGDSSGLAVWGVVFTISTICLFAAVPTVRTALADMRGKRQ